MEELKHSNIFIQYDIYHMHTMGEDYINFIRTHSNKIGHFQFADSPGRNEPGKGEINFENLFKVIDSSQYNGWVGAEYRPSVSTYKSLDWFALFS